MKKQNLNPYNNKANPHGFWIRYKKDGNLWYKGQYINNVEYGHWIDNWIDKSKSTITFYLK